ncbi:FecR domain-containing protein [Cereibacter sp. SYSU M97828]|nr:FecR domain-containing protein [Cereibacter flavus]
MSRFFDRRDETAERIWTDLDALPELAALAPPPRRSRRAVMLGGAGLAVAAGLAALPRADLATARGEARAVTLPDGSRMVLDAASSADLRFQGDARVLHLHEGRADFQVAAAARHFVILSDSGRVITRGGALTVHLWDAEMTVACHSGAVTVTGSNGGDILLAGGQEVTVGPSGNDPIRAASAAEREWQAGRLVFEDRPLRQVVADLGRHRSGRIVLRGEGIRELRVTGVFDAARSDAALDVIAGALPVRRRDLGPVTFLTPA